MSATTVRSILAMILENNLQMDDEIHFDLTECTKEINNEDWEINFVATEIIQQINILSGNKGKRYLKMMFDLQYNGQNEND